MKIYPLFLLPFLVAGCPFNKCGNGATDAREECDDGNELDADGCEADCSLPACNNGIVDPGEVCFDEPVLFETDSAPAEVVAVDLDGDTRLDLATANTSGNSLSVLLGDGTGGFVRQADIELGQVAFFVAAGDFDQDDTQDLVTSLTNADEIEVLRGVGDGTFEPLATLIAQGPNNILVADINKDGNPDVITSAADGINLFLGDGAGGFQAPRISFVGSAFGLAIADFNGDSNLDVATGVGGALVVLLGDGVGNFAPQAPQLDGEILGDITTGDFDEDAEFDIASINFSGGELGSFSQTAELFSETQTLLVTGPTNLLAKDINQDGTTDIAVTSGVDQNNTAHLVIAANEAGTFAAPLLIPIGIASPKGLELADLNADGATDAVVSDESNDQLLVFLSTP